MNIAVNHELTDIIKGYRPYRNVRLNNYAVQESPLLKLRNKTIRSSISIRCGMIFWDRYSSVSGAAMMYAAAFPLWAIEPLIMS
jgi:hypothetical protein